MTHIEKVLAFTKKGTGKSSFDNINGVSCYINCALQSIMHIDQFQQFFISVEEEHSQESLPMMYTCIRALFRGFWEENCTIRPLGIFRYLHTRGFLMNMQGDSTEVLTFIIATLHESICAPAAPAAPAAAPAAASTLLTPMETLALRDWNHHLENKTSEVVNLFWGQFLIRKECHECRTVTHKFETFHYMPLPVTDEAEVNIMQTISLLTLIERFRKRKEMDPENLLFCEKCNHKVDLATDQTSVWKLPQYLIIQLNRYYGRSAQQMKKCARIISYPESFNANLLQENKDAAAAAAAATTDKMDEAEEGEGEGEEEEEKNADETQPYLYVLQSGVLHHGQLHGGHYTFFGWNYSTKEWLHCDDNTVTSIAKPPLAHPGIYQLIYKLIPM